VECAPLPRDSTPRGQRHEGQALETGTDRRRGKPLEGRDPTAFRPLAGTVVDRTPQPHAFGSDGYIRTRFGCERFGIHGAGHRSAKAAANPVRTEVTQPQESCTRPRGPCAGTLDKSSGGATYAAIGVSRRCRRNPWRRERKTTLASESQRRYGRNPRAQVAATQTEPQERPRAPQR